MKPQIVLLLVVCVAWCADLVTPAAVAGPPAPTTRPEWNRFSLEDAAKQVREQIFRETPGMNPTAQFPIKELTTPEIWESFHVQLFKVTDGVRANQTYLVDGNQVLPIGQSVGGYGVMSMCVADLDHDGNDELYFTHSWGSGEHRSELGVWLGCDCVVSAPMALLDSDMMLEKSDDGHVRVAYGRFSDKPNAFTRDGELGTLQLEVAQRTPRLTVTLDPKLPKDVAKRVLRQKEQ